jgi:hypothetical protein
MNLRTKDTMTDHLPDPHLDAALRTLREHSQALVTPAGVEDALLAAFAQHRPSPRPKRRWWQRIALPHWNRNFGLASLAGAVLAVLLVLATPAEHRVTVQQASLDDGSDFFALVDADQIALEAAPQLVETDVARTSLAALGVSLSPDNAGDLVRAQFLVGADGRPLALRLLPLNSTPTTTPDRE